MVADAAASGSRAAACPVCGAAARLTSRGTLATHWQTLEGYLAKEPAGAE